MRWLQPRATAHHMIIWMTLSQGALIMTPGDRAGDPSGRKETAGEPGRKPWEAVSMSHYQRSWV